MAERNGGSTSDQLPPIYLVLRALAASESGVGFIYAALKVLADRYRLSDVAIVLVSSSFSTQVFRLDGRAVDTNEVAALGTSPGVYCLPDIVPQGELKTIYTACQEAYSYRFVRNIPVGDELDSAAPRPGVHPARHLEPVNDEVTIDLVTAVVSTPPIADAPTTKVRLRQVARKTPSARAQYSRVIISRLLLLIDITVLVLTAADIHGPVRLVLGLILGIVIPGWCLVAPLKLDNAALEVGLVLTVSLSLLMMMAQILMTMKLWHLVAVEEVTCALCLPFLLNQAKIVTMWSPVRSLSSTPRHPKVPSSW